MCGIAGFVGQRPGAVSLERLTAMQRQMLHRGPDGDGVWMTSDARVGFAHRRLSIVDLSDGAAQPMSSPDGRAIVTFNGEIYNHRQLRRDLEQAGMRFRSDHSDTEVLLNGFLAWGLDGLLGRANGIFAFALYDAVERRCFLVRDPMGVKPLYFAPSADGVLFASEIKAMAVDPAFSADISPLAVFHYLSFMAAPAPLTLFHQVYKLPAGTYLELTADGGAGWTRYFDCLHEAETGSEAASGGDFRLSVDTVRRRLQQAVAAQCQADVPVGVFLSGGVDSSALAALAAQQLSGRVDAFSVGFSDHTELNEIDEAAAVARDLGIPHHAVQFDAAEMSRYVERLARDQDEPIADWVCVPLYFLSKLAREAGMKVVLVGEGADELFCGYPVYQRYLGLARREWRIARLLSSLRLDGFVRRRLERTARSNFAALARADFVRRAATGQPLFWGGAVVWWDLLKQRLVDPDRFPSEEALHPMIAGMAAEHGATAFDSGRVARTITQRARQAGGDELAAMTYLELMNRLPELLLMRVDKMTMANSLEARVPFLDRELVRYAARLTEPQKIPGGHLKKLLKEAVRGWVPERVLTARKRGFGAPMSAWLRGPFGAQCRSVLLDSRFVQDRWFDGALIERLFSEHQDGTADNAVFLWTLFNLAAWSACWTGR